MPDVLTKEPACGETINLRASRRQKTLIDRAAEALGRSRSDFMLEAACREAESVLLDRRYFWLTDDAFKKFTAMLDKPPKDNPRLRRSFRPNRRGDNRTREAIFPSRSPFDSSEPVLDDWLRRRALQNEERCIANLYCPRGWKGRRLLQPGGGRGRTRARARPGKAQHARSGTGHATGSSGSR